MILWKWACRHDEEHIIKNKGSKKTDQKQRKLNQKTNIFWLEESIEHLSVLGSILEAKMDQKASEKPSEKQA